MEAAVLHSKSHSKPLYIHAFFYMQAFIAENHWSSLRFLVSAATPADAGTSLRLFLNILLLPCVVYRILPCPTPTTMCMLCVRICICVWVHTKSEDDIRSPGTKVTSGCQSLDLLTWILRTELQSLEEKQALLSHWTIFLAPKSLFFSIVLDA